MGDRVNPMRVQQAILLIMSDTRGALTPDRIRQMLRRFPPAAVDDALRFLVEGGMVEVKRQEGTARLKLGRNFRPSPVDTRPVAAPEVLVDIPPLPYASEEIVQQALAVVVQEAQRFVRGEIYLGPFMKRVMNATFPSMTNQERKGLIEHLQAQGLIRVERRQGRDGDYSVMMLAPDHPAVRDARRTVRQEAITS